MMAAKALPLELDTLCADGADPSRTKVRNKDLTKTKLCVYHSQGRCGLGDECQFAHSVTELRNAPNLAKTSLCPRFMAGRCSNQNCSYAHGEAELVKPPNFKKKICHWHQQGKCRNGDKCGFAHTTAELSTEAAPVTKTNQFMLGAKGFTKSAPDFDDASTDVPSSLSQAESDATTASSKAVRDEHLFRMMAGRGCGSLEQQVATMGAAIAELQGKLSEFEGKVPQVHVAGIKNDINQLTSACGQMGMQLRITEQSRPPAVTPPTDAHLRITEQPCPSVVQPPTDAHIRTVDQSRPAKVQPPAEKPRTSDLDRKSVAKAAKPTAVRDSKSSKGSATQQLPWETGVASGSDKKREVVSASRSSKSSVRAKAFYQKDQFRWAMAVFIVTLMIAVELYFHRQ